MARKGCKPKVSPAILWEQGMDYYKQHRSAVFIATSLGKKWRYLFHAINKYNALLIISGSQWLDDQLIISLCLALIYISRLHFFYHFAKSAILTWYQAYTLEKKFWLWGEGWKGLWGAELNHLKVGLQVCQCPVNFTFNSIIFLMSITHGNYPSYHTT